MYALSRVHTCEEELISDMLDWQRLSDRRSVHFERAGPQSVKQNTGMSMGKPDKVEIPTEECSNTIPQPQFVKLKP